MHRSTSVFVGTTLLLIPMVFIAQMQSDVVPLMHWAAPLYWQLTEAENPISAKPDAFGNVAALDTGPANSLVFVGMTPCRVVDTRPGSEFAGAFGQPNLVGNAVRTFPIQSSATCAIPSIAKAYSFNVTIVPFGFLDYITVWPTGQTRPNASTLNGYVNTVIANAAIVPAGTSGSINVYASQNTHLIIDVNGYYAQQSGITLAQGTAGAPSLSFAGDPQTGIFSSGPGALNVATGGANRLSVNSAGNVGIGIGVPLARLHVVGNGGIGVTSEGGSSTGLYGNATTGVGVYGSSTSGYAGYFNGKVAVHSNLGIGTDDPLRLLHVNGRARIGSIPLEQSFAAVCFNFAGDLLQCGASSLRWKTNVQPYRSGLDIVRRLEPITFAWKENGAADIGLGAEDVAKVIPSLVFTNSEGEVEGVKYEKVNLLLINAIKEQQEQIEDQQRRITEQQEQILQQQQQTRTLEERFAALERLLSTNVQSTAGNQ